MKNNEKDNKKLISPIRKVSDEEVAKIKELIAAEKQRKPLSDDKLSEMLGESGFKVARRTVAKYREALGIESSSKRKKL